MITPWKNIANVKRAILIGRVLDVYSLLILIKTQERIAKSGMERDPFLFLFLLKPSSFRNVNVNY